MVCTGPTAGRTRQNQAGVCGIFHGGGSAAVSCRTITVQAPQNTPDMQTTHDQQTGTTEPGFYEGVINPYLGRTRFGWEVDPVGFRTTLRAVYERYRLPLLVTENGLGDCDSLDADGTVTDDYRIEYLQAHIAQMQRAVEDGVEIIG